jgi:septal ring factor EnvC (AmiA/AmiB activator)
VSRDLLTLPPGWEGVDATLDRLRTSTGSLGDFMERLWDELEVARGELDQRARSLDHRERELARKEQELTATVKLAKLYTELAETRCGLITQTNERSRIDSALLAASARIVDLEQKIGISETS